MADSKAISDDDRDDLVAFLDGEADAATRRQVEGRLDRDPAVRAEAESLKRAWEMLDHLPQPEPSPMFTTQTLSRLSALRPSAPTISVRAAPAPPITGRPWVVWAAVILGAFAVGLLIGKPKSVPPLSADDPLLVKDLRVIDNLPLYAPVENFDFLLALDQPELFGSDAIGP